MLSYAVTITSSILEESHVNLYGLPNHQPRDWEFALHFRSKIAVRNLDHFSIQQLLKALVIQVITPYSHSFQRRIAISVNRKGSARTYQIRSTNLTRAK